jgi:hypothetical protein
MPGMSLICAAIVAGDSATTNATIRVYRELRFLPILLSEIVTRPEI